MTEFIPLQFRNDINGLRASAVIAVMLFHFNSAWLPGGFAGVDVFFVISGFLMTSIIFRGLETDNFSVLKFYVSRANRIIPALAFLCIVLLVFGWFYITPLDYKALGKHVGGSISFISNFMYWRESGYFDVASHEKWLLHTWSLSTEWQFYILYPLALVVMRKFMSFNMMKATLLVATVLGFLISIFLTHKLPNSSYYLLPTRFWEMLVGGVAYLYPLTLSERQKKPMEWFGLALIVLSYVFISKANAWPGYLAIVPVMGTFLVIQAHRDNSLITSNSVFQKLGRWSYSIYLWHWPLVVAISYYSLNTSFIYLGLALSLLLGFLSYTYIETIKFKNYFESILAYLKCKPVYIALLTCLFGSLTFAGNGFESHYSQAVINADRESLNRNPHHCITTGEVLAPCFIGNKNNIKAIIVGDSHADALTSSLSSTVDLDKDGIVALTISSCPFVLNAKLTKFNKFCYQANKARMEYLTQNYKNIPVFWVARTPIYAHGLSDPKKITESKDTKPLIYFKRQYDLASEAFFSEFKLEMINTIAQLKINHPVYLVQPTPEMNRNIPKTLARNYLVNAESDLSISYADYQERNKQVRQLIEDVSETTASEVLDPIPYLCDGLRCKAEHENRPIFYDADHLSEYGNKLLTPMFEQAMANHSL
jgi:peptidoglycan/LPS O-acetylase OafA/YrhL